jgi:hypothetical protein
MRVWSTEALALSVGESWCATRALCQALHFPAAPTIGAIPLVAEKWDRRSSPRPISTAQLKESPLLHPRPINQMVSLGSYPVIRWEILSWSGLRT